LVLILSSDFILFLLIQVSVKSGEGQLYRDDTHRNGIRHQCLCVRERKANVVRKREG
jgi:hypothetical protein